MRILKSNYFILFCFLMVGGLLSAHLRYEILWDFANYHYFNPWAFLNNRVGYDIGVSGLSAFFNPLIDIPLYGMIQIWNDYPALISFMQGLWFGALLFVFSKILLLFFDFKTIQGKISVVLGLLIASTGWATFMQIGTSSNEIQLALLVLISFYLLLKEIFFNKTGKWYIFFFAGFILGSAVGLKPTSFVSCLAIGFTILIFYKEIINFKRNISLFILGGLVGFLVFNGFWMYILWDKYQNPFFPFFNEIFQSEYMPHTNHSDTSFLPRSWYEYVLYPFQTFIAPIQQDKEILYLDSRPAIFVCFTLYVSIIFIKNKIFHQANKITNKHMFLFLVLFFYYTMWLFVFAIRRYYIPFEMLFAIFIVSSFWRLFPKRELAQNLYIGVSLIILYMLISTSYYGSYWGKQKLIPDYKGLVAEDSYDKYINVDDITLPKKVLLLIYNYPSSFLLPTFANQNNNIRGIVVRQSTNIVVDDVGNNYDLFAGNLWRKEKEKILKDESYSKIAIVSSDSSYRFDVNSDPYLRDMICRDLKNNIKPLQLCVPSELEYMIFGNKENSNE